MYKGTTPTIVCDINIDTTQISAIRNKLIT